MIDLPIPLTFFGLGILVTIGLRHLERRKNFRSLERALSEEREKKPCHGTFETSLGPVRCVLPEHEADRPHEGPIGRWKEGRGFEEIGGFTPHEQDPE